MLSMEKIKNNVDEQIINTIDKCVKDQDIQTLEKWLADCQKEIKSRKTLGMNVYSLQCEKYYLQTVIGT